MQDLAKPLSFSATVRQLKSAFDDQVPLFAIYYKNDARWERGRGFEGSRWIAAQSVWTTKWFSHGYARGREILELPRTRSPLVPGSLVDGVRERNRPLLFHAYADIGGRTLETTVLLRPRSYGREVAQVFVVGVEKAHAPILQPQINIVGPAAKTGEFAHLFTPLQIGDTDGQEGERRRNDLSALRTAAGARPSVSGAVSGSTSSPSPGPTW